MQWSVNVSILLFAFFNLKSLFCICEAIRPAVGQHEHFGIAVGKACLVSPHQNSVSLGNLWALLIQSKRQFTDFREVSNLNFSSVSNSRLKFGASLLQRVDCRFRQDSKPEFAKRGAKLEAGRKKGKEWSTGWEQASNLEMVAVIKPECGIQ